MRRMILAALAALAALAVGVGAPAAWAGSPHFVTVEATRSGNTLTVSGKEAGLGDEEQIEIVLSATAECINKGEQHPKAENKQSVTSAAKVPVQNGKANFSLELTATFKPECAPPMTVAFTNVKVEDTTNGLRANLPGTF
jgi:hypothetical protein